MKIVQNFLILLLSISVYAQQEISLSGFNYKAASILPITIVEEKNGKKTTYALLAQEAFGSDKGTYDDFGGGKERYEKNPLDTAVREFCEELITADTMNMDEKALHAYVADTKNIHAIVAQKNAGSRRSNYVTYIAYFKPELMDQAKNQFYKARNRAWALKYREKYRLALVDYQQLRQAALNQQNLYDAQVSANIVDPKTGAEKTETITLRPIFLAKLRNFFRDYPTIPLPSSKTIFYE